MEVIIWIKVEGNLGIDILERSYGKWWLMLLDGLCFIALSIFAVFFSNHDHPAGFYFWGLPWDHGIHCLSTDHGGINMMPILVSVWQGESLICSLPLSSYWFLNVLVVFFIIIIGIWAIITGIFLLIVSANSGNVGRIVKIVMGVALIGFGIYALLIRWARQPLLLCLLVLLLVYSWFVFGNPVDWNETNLYPNQKSQKRLWGLSYWIKWLNNSESLSSSGMRRTGAAF